MKCLFCKIIDKEVPKFAVYEDEHVLSFLDIYPCAKGHTVVIPKIHAETILGLDDEYTKALILGVQKTMERIQEKLGPDGFNVGWNHNKIAGQSVFHMHIHIIPRWENDGGGNMHSIINNKGDKTVEEIAKLFK